MTNAAEAADWGASTDLDLVPPHDLDAEGTVLSHCLERGPIAGLLPVHFYSDANRYVYEALSSVAQPPDIIDVKRYLRERDLVGQIGGIAYLGTLVFQPATAYQERHAETVREMYRRRVLSDALLRLRVELRVSDLKAGEAWGRLKAICWEMRVLGHFHSALRPGPSGPMNGGA